jgi:hypothetical protein
MPQRERLRFHITLIINTDLKSFTRSFWRILRQISTSEPILAWGNHPAEPEAHLELREFFANLAEMEIRVRSKPLRKQMVTHSPKFLQFMKAAYDLM